MQFHQQMHAELIQALTNSGFVSRRGQPHLQSAINRARANGDLIQLLPGTYAAANTPATLIPALLDWDPNAILIGAAAAKALWWPDLQLATIDAFTARRLRREVPGLQLTTGQVHPELVTSRNGAQVQIPAASTLDLARCVGPTAIDEAFRRRATKPAELEWALKLMPGRPGNTDLAAYLKASRDEPWSAFERQAHADLRRAGITGWKANYRIELNGTFAFLDIAFPGPKLDVELDGWRYHSDRESFIRDRKRDVLLHAAGWTPLRFTMETLPMMIPAIRRHLGK